MKKKGLVIILSVFVVAATAALLLHNANDTDDPQSDWYRLSFKFMQFVTAYTEGVVSLGRKTTNSWRN